MHEIKSGYTRVSQILSVIPSKIGKDSVSGQPIFGFPMRDIPVHVLSRKAEIGTRVHQAISMSHEEEFFPLANSEKGYYKSYQVWQKAVDLIPNKTELRLYHDALKLTGCVDMIGVMEGSSLPFLIDFKTAIAEDRAKWPIQAAFYHMLLAQEGYAVSDKAIFVILDREGGMPKICMYQTGKSLTTAAISAYNLYHYLTEK